MKDFNWKTATFALLKELKGEGLMKNRDDIEVCIDISF